MQKRIVVAPPTGDAQMPKTVEHPECTENPGEERTMPKITYKLPPGLPPPLHEDMGSIRLRVDVFGFFITLWVDDPYKSINL